MQIDLCSILSGMEIRPNLDGHHLSVFSGQRLADRSRLDTFDLKRNHNSPKCFNEIRLNSFTDYRQSLSRFRFIFSFPKSEIQNVPFHI